MIDPCSLEAKPLLSVDKVLEKISKAIRPVEGTERVELQNALGRVLAEAIYSPINIPYARNSAMDGYALSSQDIRVDQVFTLSLAGVSWAGKPFEGTVQSGQCVRIFTGALVPDGADTVVIQEQVQVEGERIVFPARVMGKQNIREAGEDIRQGERLCEHQKKLSPADLGLLASAGIDTVVVKRKLNIAFFSTGDELVSLGQTLTPGKIYDSNRYVLAGLLSDVCNNFIDMGVVCDDKQKLEAVIKQAAESADVIITTGGASVGDADFVKVCLDACGTVDFWKIAIKPGKPLAFGRIGGCYFFGLPGNPVSTMVTFQQIVAPALRQLSGAKTEKPLRIFATSSTSFKKAVGRQEFQRGILTQDAKGQFFVVSCGQQGSHMLSSMSRSNCYVIFSAESEGVTSGEQVLIEPFSLFF